MASRTRSNRPAGNNESVTISKFQYLEDEENSVPGPGAYKIPGAINVRKGPRFGSSKRRDIFKVNDIPGPGAYVEKGLLPERISQSNATTPTKERPAGGISFAQCDRPPFLPKIDNPTGPGQYKLPDHFKKIALKGKVAGEVQTEVRTTPQTSPRDRSAPRFTHRNAGPGPGDYYISPMKSNQHQYRMGKQDRDTSSFMQIAKNGLEGDKYYNYNHNNSSLDNGQQRSFNRSQRPPLHYANSPNPGPGYYDVENQGGTSNKKSNRQEEWSPSQNNFGKSQKADPFLSHNSNLHNPGPGNYEVLNNDIAQEKSKGITFTKSQRPDPAAKNNNPGPGSYRTSQEELLDRDRSKSFDINLGKIPATTAEDKADEVNHTTDHRGGHGNQRYQHILTTGRSHVSSQFQSRQGSVVLPVRKKSPFRSSYFDEVAEKSISPGPKYTVVNQNISAIAGEVGTRFPNQPKPELFRDQENEYKPGPGKYQSNVFEVKKVPDVKFNHSKRNSKMFYHKHAMDVPSVWNYNPQLPKEKPKGGVFSTALRGGKRKGVAQQKKIEGASYSINYHY